VALAALSAKIPVPFVPAVTDTWAFNEVYADESTSKNAKAMPLHDKNFFMKLCFWEVRGKKIFESGNDFRAGKIP